MITEPELRGKIYNSLDVIQGIIDTHTVMGGKYTSESDYQNLLSRYKSLVELQTYLNLYTENYEGDEKISLLKRKVDTAEDDDKSIIAKLLILGKRTC